VEFNLARGSRSGCRLPPSRSDGEENGRPNRPGITIPRPNPNARPAFRPSHPNRSSTSENARMLFLVQSRGEGVPGPGAGRAAGSIAGLPGHGEPRVRRGFLALFACRGLSQGGTGTNRVNLRRRANGTPPLPAEELPSTAALARTGRAEHGRPRRNSTLEATIREGCRQRYPGGIARAPPLPRHFSATAREDDETRPSPGGRRWLAQRDG
jgi:hypothetical protein